MASTPFLLLNVIDTIHADMTIGSKPGGAGRASPGAQGDSTMDHPAFRPRRTVPQDRATQVPWPADSPLDANTLRCAGVGRYRLWQRGGRRVAVREGWCWPAALLPRLWPALGRQWRPALRLWLASAVGSGTLLLAAAWLPPAVPLAAGGLLELGLRVHCGRRAWRWRERALRRDGWQPGPHLWAISARDALTSAALRDRRTGAAGR